MRKRLLDVRWEELLGNIKFHYLSGNFQVVIEFDSITYRLPIRRQYIVGKGHVVITYKDTIVKSSFNKILHDNLFNCVCDYMANSGYDNIVDEDFMQSLYCMSPTGKKKNLYSMRITGKKR